MMTNSMTCGLIAAAACTTMATANVSDELLCIDLSVTDQITILATDGLAAATVSGSNFTGVYFDNFYNGAGSSLSASLVSGDLTSAANPSDESPSLFRGGGGTDTGLNLWSFSTDSTVDFVEGDLAFVGSATWDLDSAMYNDMLNGNDMGDLYFPADTSDDVNDAFLIGTYKVVVPAPASLPLLGLGFAAMRRRR